MFVINDNISPADDPGALVTLEKIKEVINTFRIESLKQELSILERYPKANKYIDVVVLGQFKAGKSSLINSLAGENILPVGVIPVTSIVTRLQFAAQRSARVIFSDDTYKDIRDNEIADFVTELKNPKNIKNVKLVDVFLPQLSKFKNIRLIDTPGLGSYFKHNSQTTMQWLPEIGLALMAISAERPLSEDDLLLLKNISRYAAETKIIITKADLISQHQLDEITEYIKRTLISEDIPAFSQDNDAQLTAKKTGLEILCYSTMLNTKRNRKQLIEKIFDPLKEDFIYNYKKIFSYKIKSLIQSCLSYLNIGLQSVTKSEAEKEVLKEAIIDEHLKYQIIKNELDIISTAYVNKNREAVSQIVMAGKNSITGSLEIDFQEKFDSWRGNLYKLSRQFEAWLQNSLREILQDYSQKAIMQLYPYMHDIQNHFNLFLSSFEERLKRNVENVLGLELNTITLKAEIEKIRQPDISISYSFDIHVDLLWFLIPMPFFRKIFKKFFRKKISFEVYKNLNRLTSDITENISREIERNRQEVINYVRNELSTIENVIKNKKDEPANFRKAIEEIAALSAGSRAEILYQK
jgi:predicted GTPase